MKIVNLARSISAFLVIASVLTADARIVPTVPRSPLPSGPIAGAENLVMLVITAPIVTTPVVAGVRTSVSVKVANARNGSTLRVKPIALTPGCSFVTLQPVTSVTATVTGTTTVAVPGMFVDAGNAGATTCVSGPCRVTPSSMSAGAGGFSSTTNPVTANGSVVGANPLGAGYPVFGIAALNLSLDCDNTASNDRFATLVIKSLTFVGPPNLAGFP